VGAQHEQKTGDVTSPVTMTLGGDSGCYTTSQLNQAAILLVSRNVDIELMPRIHRNWSAVECFKWTDASAIGDGDLNYQRILTNIWLFLSF
jgi:hypothetical protein